MTTHIAREETRYRHMVYSFRYAARDLLYASDRIIHTTAFVTPVVEYWLEQEIPQCVHHDGSIRQPIAPRATSRSFFGKMCHTHTHTHTHTHLRVGGHKHTTIKKVGGAHTYIYIYIIIIIVIIIKVYPLIPDHLGFLFTSTIFLGPEFTCA